MPVHTIRSQSDDTRFVDGLPVGFSAFEPEAETGTGVELLDPETEDLPTWSEIVSPVAARDEEEDEDYDDDDDDDLWDDDDDDDDDDDFEDEEEEDFDDDDEDPLTFDDDDDEF